MNLEKLNRKEKVELIRRITAGEVNVVAGQLIESGVILIRSGKDYFLNGEKCELSDFNEFEVTIIILPENAR